MTRPAEREPTPAERLQQALEIAYRYLNRRERTEAEVRHRLDQAGTPPATIEQALAELREHNVVDDRRFAELFVEDKRSLEQWGSERIRRTLIGRGIARELADEVLDQDAPEDELHRALELLRHRFRSPPQERRERDRALGMMLRKGYDSELAVDALAVYARDTAADEHL